MLAAKTKMPLSDVIDHPTVNELGLITQADIDRDPHHAMRNVYGRFYNYLGKRIKESALAPDAFTDTVEEQTEYNLIRRKAFRVQPMSIEEAILQMNMLGHSFFIFQNADNGTINIVYRRNDDNYALLEPTTD